MWIVSERVSVSPCGLSMSGWGQWILCVVLSHSIYRHRLWPASWTTVCSTENATPQFCLGSTRRHCEHVCDGWWYTLFNSLLFWVSCRSAPIRDWDKTFRDGGWYLLNMSIRVMKYFLPPHSCSPTEGGGARLSSQPISWCKCETVSILKLLIAIDAPAVPPPPF